MTLFLSLDLLHQEWVKNVVMSIAVTPVGRKDTGGRVDEIFG